jgi:hypothetical protein
MVNLGDRVRCRINGFEGIVTGRAEYRYGCVQVLVAPTKLAADGKCPDSVWFDEERVEVTASEEVKRPASADERAGGPLMGPTPPGR